MAQTRIEGWEFLDWDENDYAVVDETGSAGFTWSGLVQPMPVPPRNIGMADTLDEAKGRARQALRGGQKRGK